MSWHLHLRRFARVCAQGMVIVSMIGLSGPMATSAEIEQARRVANTQFTASSRSIVFPVPLSGDTFGLIHYDRSSKQFGLVAEDGFTLSSPQLTPDGRRLLFVRRESSKSTRQLMSCELAGWRCQVLLTTENAVFSPIEIAPKKYLFSASPFSKRPNGRLDAFQFDFYFFEEGATPRRLTEFHLYQLSSLSLVGSRLMFSASAYGNTYTAKGFARPAGAKLVESEIFELRYVSSRDQIEQPENPLTPKYYKVLEGFSGHPSQSNDGKYVAFLHRQNEPNKYHFNIAVVEGDSSIVLYLKTPGFGFSRPAFVDNHIIVNELFDDRYVGKQFDVPGGAPTIVFELPYGTDFKKLVRIQIRTDH